MRWRARLFAVLLVSASLMPVTTTAQASAAQNQTYTVWHWNIAGNTRHHGGLHTGVLEHAANSIANRGADFVSVNEICWGQYQRLQTLLVQKGWPASADFARFAATREPKAGICNSNETFGHAVFSRQDIGISQQYELPWDGRAGTRKLICAPLQATPLMKFCSVHVTTGPREGETVDHRPAQLKEMLRILDGFHAAGQTYVVAGDFNVQPDQTPLNSYYSASANTPQNPGNFGAHRELDDTDTRCPGYGEWTADVSSDASAPCDYDPRQVKLDLFMARESRIVGAYDANALDLPRDCAVVEKDCSDHHVVVGTVTLRVG